MRFAEYDSVILTVDRPDIGLSKGARGTVLDVYPQFDDYEVEFCDSDGITIFMGAIPDEQLMPYLKGADRMGYTVLQLLSTGARFTDDFEPEDAVQMYLELHPEAIEADVRAELLAELTKRGMSWT